MSEYQPTPPASATYTTTPYSSQAGPYGGPTERYNVLAIIGFVFAFTVSIGAVVCGHIALSQIKRTGEKGRGFAIAALILGYLGIVLGTIIAIVYIALFASLASSGSLNR